MVDECGKIDFMSIVQSIGSQIKVSIDTGFEGKIPHPHQVQSVFRPSSVSKQNYYYNK